ncbi:MAG: hypothetical protein Pg6C_17680 [Treponemataceae bacterium]|nr:MAG: hypothetical protein Pg6C_17680 [Treponemataceae bacterium]
MKTNKMWMITAILVAVAATAAFAQTEADFNVGLTDDGAGVVIVKYTGKTAAVRIPATIQGMPVKEIGSSAFWKSGITSVVIPQGVTLIGSNAFSECYNLTSVTIPDSVTEIGSGAFSSSGLTSVTLPKGLTKTGGRMFSECTKLKTVTIPEGVTVISDFMFASCSALTSIKIPNSVTSIGRGVFSNFSGWEGCDALTSITLGSGITAIPDEFAKYCKSLTSIAIPEGVTKIGENAFSGCYALTTVTIPDSIETIEFSQNSAFQWCSKLSLASQAAIKRRGYRGNF